MGGTGIGRSGGGRRTSLGKSGGGSHAKLIKRNRYKDYANDTLMNKLDYWNSVVRQNQFRNNRAVTNAKRNINKITEVLEQRGVSGYPYK